MKLLLIILVSLLASCEQFQGFQKLWKKTESKARKETKPIESVKTESREPPPQKEEPQKMVRPVPFWEKGKTEKEVDIEKADLQGYLILDLGEAWTPYIFSDGNTPDGEPAPNAYRETYLALARGEFPNNHHGERARDDKYLELYGILPTLHLLRKRYRHVSTLKCAGEIDLEPLINFEQFVSYRSNELAKKSVGDFIFLRNQVKLMMKRQKVSSPEEIDPSALDKRSKGRLSRYFEKAPEYYAIRATQERLKCEGFFKGKGRYLKGGMDWATHEALAEFERRHRVYGWGYLGNETRRVLKMSPLEAERDGVVRILTERAMHAAAVIEDGSTSTLSNGERRTFIGLDGGKYPIQDFWHQLETIIIEAFGLQTPESTLAWLESLGELDKDGHLLVAVRRPELPEYYDGDMLLYLEYDRGDVWYDFPYNDQGEEKAQPVRRRPRITLFVKYNKQRIPLAWFGTTIGGWRSEKIGDHIMWKYKESPVGWRVWQQIIASPVWLPPDGTPPRDILVRRRDRKPNEPHYQVNYHETGPSYASAYGLVAAYHRKYLKRADGKILIGGDEGIRTHGSVDYMSIMRRHSHGCHRMHNHLAVRLMSFVLKHRPHLRLGQQQLSFHKIIEYENETYNMDILKGGYVFQLEQPLEVNVLEGRIRGKMKTPYEVPIPKYDVDAGAYLLPDAGPILIRNGELIPAPPPKDAGLLPPAMDFTQPLVIPPLPIQ